jgi:hypothetical protein
VAAGTAGRPQEQQQQQQPISKGATRHLMARPDPASADTAAAGPAVKAAPNAAATTAPALKAGQQPVTAAAKQQGPPTPTPTVHAAGAKPGSAAGATPTQKPAMPGAPAAPAAVRPAPLPVFKAALTATAPHPPLSKQQQPQQQQGKTTTHPSAPQAPAPPKPPAPKRIPLPLSELPTRQARFDAGRDELRYSLRALEQYLPWYRRLYIVTNGQVG